jgi:hypothetical protein
MIDGAPVPFSSDSRRASAVGISYMKVVDPVDRCASSNPGSAPRPRWLTTERGRQSALQPLITVIWLAHATEPARPFWLDAIARHLVVTQQ